LSTEEAAAAAAAPFAACENVRAAEAYEGGEAAEAAEAAEAGMRIASLPPAVDEEATTPATPAVALSEAEAALAFLKKPVAYRMRESRLPAFSSFLSLGGGGL
jgi:hypothetical protein